MDEFESPEWFLATWEVRMTMTTTDSGSLQHKWDKDEGNNSRRQRPEPTSNKDKHLPWFLLDVALSGTGHLMPRQHINTVRLETTALQLGQWPQEKREWGTCKAIVHRVKGCCTRRPNWTPHHKRVTKNQKNANRAPSSGCFVSKLLKDLMGDSACTRLHCIFCVITDQRGHLSCGTAFSMQMETWTSIRDQGHGKRVKAKARRKKKQDKQTDNWHRDKQPKQFG